MDTFGLSRFVGRIDPVFAAAAAVMLAVNGIGWSADLLPGHDSFQVYHVFHYFHSGLVFNGRAPEWVPYGAFGMPADFWERVCLTPASWLCLLVGWAAGITDSLALFRASVLLEQAAYLLGMRLLAGQLFERRVTMLTVCVGAAGTVYWYEQIWWDLRIFHLFPLGLHFFLLFFRGGRPAHLWAAGIVFAMSLPGNLGYYGPLYLFLLTISGAVLTGRDPARLLALLRHNRLDAAALALFLLIVGVQIWLTAASLSGLGTSSHGREDGSMTTRPGNFLAHGGHPDTFRLVRQVLTGWPVAGNWSGAPNNTPYVGLLPLFLAGWAAVRVRTAPFPAIAAATAALLWLSLGGWFAWLAYHFPTMSLFRHVGLVYGLAKPLVLLCAGFGLDDFLRTVTRRHLAWGAVLLVVIADALWNNHLSRSGFASLWQEEAPQLWRTAWNIRFELYAGLLVLLIAADVVRQGLRPTTAAAGIIGPTGAALLGVVFAFDLLLFQAVAVNTRRAPPESLAPVVEQAARAAPTPYVASRRPFPDDPRGRALQPLIEWASDKDARLNQTAHVFTRNDPCRSMFFVAVMTRDVRAMLAARAGDEEPPREYWWGTTELRAARGIDAVRAFVREPPDDAALARILGCGAPKLRLVADAAAPGSRDEALALIRSRPDLDRIVVVPAGPTTRDPATVAAPGSAGSAEVAEFDPDRLVAEADVAAPGGAWLVYADAYHPDWTARIDGADAEVLPAYLAFKAVRLPPGRHTVELRFRPGTGLTRIRLSAAVGAAWAALLAVACVAMPTGALPAAITGRPAA
jgi:hypothetical protein